MAERHNIYRDGKVHVLGDKCSTCIFRPKERPVSGARVAELVKATVEGEVGSTIVCHSTLFGDADNAICRGWWDRFADEDPVCRLAIATGVVEEVDEPRKG